MSEHSRFSQFAARSLIYLCLRSLMNCFTPRAGVGFVLRFGGEPVGADADSRAGADLAVRLDACRAKHKRDGADSGECEPDFVWQAVFPHCGQHGVCPAPLCARLKMSDGLFHNVLFVATENDSVYAFDADSNSGANANPIWHVSLLTAAYGAGAGATRRPWTDTGSPDVAPTVGITGTPTINPATNTIYLVASTKENGGYFSRLHAINIITGAEQANSPANITATVAGTGTGSSGGQVSFSALWENQRTALNYYNGYVYFGYAAHGDKCHGTAGCSPITHDTRAECGPVSFSQRLRRRGMGIGRRHAHRRRCTGRTDVRGHRQWAFNLSAVQRNTEYGESIINFSLANGGLTPTDAFTSFNFQTLNNGDLDQGSGGVLMVPDQQGTHPHILVQAGKEGRIVVLDRDNLGGYARQLVHPTPMPFRTSPTRRVCGTRRPTGTAMFTYGAAITMWRNCSS